MMASVYRIIVVQYVDVNAEKTPGLHQSDCNNATKLMRCYTTRRSINKYILFCTISYLKNRHVFVILCVGVPSFELLCTFSRRICSSIK